MLSVRKRCLCWVSLLLVVALVGCGRRSVVKVTGTLTYKGKAVTNAYIQFLPEQGRQSWAQTDEQGRFKINYDAQQDGAVVGKHKVWVERRAVTVADKEAEMRGDRPAAPSKELAAFFDKYSANKSTLTVTITKDTKDLKLDLD